MIRQGGAGNKFLMILEGKCDAYIHATKGTKKWDTCSGHALLKCINGSVTNIHGNDILYDDITRINANNNDGIIATWKSGSYHNSFIHG
mmetsp:Transcript_77583/g.95077  ORF Transcript_77583/g.95077 Transcript_77583/m.95077 type:complete len:89 (-) Transcript_77583:336-602(-)